MATTRASKSCLTKWCPKCEKNRGARFFYGNRAQPDGLGVWCKTCSTKQYKVSSSVIRKGHLKLKYGITTKEYDTLLKHQRNRCGACKRHESLFQRRLAVDHCHKTKTIRGLLCNYCNHRVIGRHTLEWLEGAVDYLRDPPALHVLGDRAVPERKKRG